MLQDSTMDIYEELDRAAKDSNRQVFEEITRRPEFNVNGKPGIPLLVAYADRSKPEWCIIHLIKAGADVNLCDISGKSPLYATLWSGRIAPEVTRITIELMKRGADLNTVHQYNPDTSALHTVVCYSNTDLLYVFLYYAANIYIRNNKGMTALKLSVIRENLSADDMKMLLHFHDKSYFLNGPMEDYFYRPGNFIHMDCEGTALLAHSCRNETYFRLLWRTMESMGILNEVVTASLLFYFVKFSDIWNEHWLHYLYLVLNILCSPNRCDRTIYFEDTFFYFLINNHMMWIREQDYILIVSSACLSLGAPIFFGAIDDVFLESCVPEVTDLFLYACDRFLDVDSFSPAPLKYMFNGDVPNRDVHLELYNDFGKRYYIYKMAPFFHISTDLYREMRSKCDKITDVIEKESLDKSLEEIHLFPSLMELSRDAARKFLKNHRLVSCPYHFLEIDQRLNLPKLIKDIISYKTPLYTQELKIQFFNWQRPSRSNWFEPV